MSRTIARVAGLGLAVAGLWAGQAEAARTRRPHNAVPHKHYDGVWNITLQVTEGRCMRVSYPAEIRDGRLVYEGFFAVQVEGGVSRNGQIAVKLTYRGQSATGKGRVKNNMAAGTWDAPPLQCRGTWSGARASAQ